MDKTTMFTVNYKIKEGDTRSHEVKALQIIWDKYPQLWNAKNTVHVDDLSRNFVLNPKNGIKIHAFKVILPNSFYFFKFKIKTKNQNAPTSRANDKELLFLRKYLTDLANSDDLTKQSHDNWKKSLGDRN